MKRIVIIVTIIILVVVAVNYTFRKFNFNQNLEIGQKIDSLQGVYVYYNGGVNNAEGRNWGKDGYNIGLKYQCVEFVKRYYYEHYQHKMPNSFGNAIDFFDPKLVDGEKNLKRDLIQYRNPSSKRPEVGDLLIYSATKLNQFGHVAIVSKVDGDEVEIIQQNPGPFAKSREKYKISLTENRLWKIDNSRILGWLRKE